MLLDKLSAIGMGLLCGLPIGPAWYYYFVDPETNEYLWIGFTIGAILFALVTAKFWNRYFCPKCKHGELQLSGNVEMVDILTLANHDNEDGGDDTEGDVESDFDILI